MSLASDTLSQFDQLPSRLVRSVVVATPPQTFELQSDRTPPDKFDLLRQRYRLHLRNAKLSRQSGSFTAPFSPQNDLDLDKAQLEWMKNNNGDSASPTSLRSPDHDPLPSYTACASFNNILLNICEAPKHAKSTHSAKEDLVLKVEDSIQSDSGANANITPHLHLLHNVRWFTPVPIGNAQKDSTLTVEAIGKFPLHTDQGIIFINMYYSPNASNTIISPTAICSQVHGVTGFNQWSDVSTKTGHIQFLYSDPDNQQNFRINLLEDNGLWYHSDAAYISTSSGEIHVNALSDAAKYELWHQRLGHCGSWAMTEAHKHCVGVPKLRGNSFYKCPSCMMGKLCTKRSNIKRNRNLGTVLNYNSPDSQPASTRDTTSTDAASIDTFVDSIHLPKANPGQHFHLDFGFVRGSEYDFVNDEGKKLTSIDGKNAYLLIADRRTRYMWVYLCNSKETPLDAVEMILSKFGSNYKHRTVRSDQNKGLSMSMLDHLNFTPESTGTDNSQQNTRAE